MPIEPSEIRNLLFAFFFAAMVIGSGVLYAVFITLARRLKHHGLTVAARLSYIMLTGFVFALAWAANLDGPWWILVALMLFGYYFMPRMILRLCEDTHAYVQEKGQSDG